MSDGVIAKFNQDLKKAEAHWDGSIQNINNATEFTTQETSLLDVLIASNEEYANLLEKHISEYVQHIELLRASQYEKSK